MEVLLRRQEAARQLMREKDGDGAVAAVEQALADFEAHAVANPVAPEAKDGISSRPNEPLFWTPGVGEPSNLCAYPTDLPSTKPRGAGVLPPKQGKGRPFPVFWSLSRARAR